MKLFLSIALELSLGVEPITADRYPMAESPGLDVFSVMIVAVTNDEVGDCPTRYANRIGMLMTIALIHAPVANTMGR